MRVSQLLLDPENPRLPHFASPPTQDELLELIVKRYTVSELIESFAINGYFEEEPLVAVPESPRRYVVVEGNRRLAALKLIHDRTRASSLRISIPPITKKRLAELERVPVRVHKTRSEVLPFLGYRHITGVMPWDSYSKARYVAQLVEQARLCLLFSVGLATGTRLPRGSIEPTFFGNS